MRTQLPVIRYLVLVLALVFSTGTVAADSRSEAKAHYQAGVKLYNAADYKGAIKEFSAAQELLPADLNNYNLALCYDKLGEPEPAIQYYRAFLDKQPSSDKRAEIESSISRLENASKSAAAKKAAKEKEEQAKRDAEAKRIADEEAKKTAEDAKRAEEAKQTEESKRTPEEVGGVGVGGAVGVGSTGTPGGSGTVSTGDSQLDRVSRINIDEVRDQRLGGSTSGMPDSRTQTPGMAPNGAAAGGNAAANIDVNARAGGTANANTANAATPPANNTGAAPQPNAPDPSDKPKATPVYKKWWFWAVVAVSAYVVYSIATEDDKSNNTRAREMLPPIGNQRATPGGGMTLFSW